jgi:hypothetical protein
MHSTETVSQAAGSAKEQSRKRKAILLGEEFCESNRIFSEYYHCLMEKCDPVEQAIILNLKEVVENYERCIAKILISGFTIDECMKAYTEGGGC